MAEINEQLIRQVFDEMVKTKPALSKYLIEEDEDEDEVDIRLLTDQLIKNFPWPIGIELRRLFSGVMRKLDLGRLDQLFKTTERTIQFISFVMVIELVEAIKAGKIQVDDTFSEQFRKRFYVLSLGNYTWLIRAIGNLFIKHEAEFFMTEMAGICNKKFYAALDSWVPERNEIDHYQINLTDWEIEKRCVMYEEKLAYILSQIAFHVKYRMVTIREIKVNKRHNKEAQFQHLIDILNSADSDFRSNSQIYDHYVDSNAVLLMKSIKEPKDFLNLSPLIIDTRPEVIDDKDKFELKKDIFLYTKFQGDKIFYVGTQIINKCDLSSLSSYNNLLEEYADIMDTISSTETAA